MSASGSPRSNRLAEEKSPYLLQHAHNPVDWYAWGDDALRRAREDDRPIFLSIGYSTCHWCHVMERESFEDESIAAIMNDHFVCVKVDREERPDLDEIYMAAVQALTGQGGWPLSVWLTPELEPFYGGTYFPPDDRYGRPGFPRVLRALAEAWATRREEIVLQSGRLTEALRGLTDLPPSDAQLDRSVVDVAYERLRQIHDPRHGGWGSAPKFPRADFGNLCLRVFRRTGDRQALGMATSTLDGMARGGIYDHLGGGFARYSTDDRWLVPHFEKMLYDNAQLAFHYLEAHQLTARSEYARVARETLDYVLRDMTHPEGGFYSAEDADSEGVEGKYYVWTQEEVEAVLPEFEGALFMEAYGVTESGNWEGRCVLERVATDAQLALRHDVAVEEVQEVLDSAKGRLLEVRERRVRPGLDDKVLTAWNGLMMQALARGAVVLDEPRYLDAAHRAADFVRRELRHGDGLLRRWRDGEARFHAYAEDYATYVRGLLELYQAGFDPQWLALARELHDEMHELFGDAHGGALFHTRAGSEDLIVRARAGYDGSVPTANSVAAQNALLLHELTADDSYAEQVEGILHAFGRVLRSSPLAMTSLLLVLDAWQGERVQLVLSGEATGGTRATLLRRARAGYHPDLVVAARGQEAGEMEELAPIVRGKEPVDGAATAYVCRGFSCGQPTTDLETMALQLDLLRADAPDGGDD